MSAEKINQIEEKSFTSLETPRDDEPKVSKRVDINDLIARASKEKKREDRTNVVFFGLFASVILVVGTILSF
jgi:hypothetical protein